MFRYAITDGWLPLSPSANDVVRLAERCGELARDGVDVILIREKQLPAGELAAVCRAVIGAVRAADPWTQVLVAQRLDMALAVGTDGVHLSAGAGELTPQQVRELMPGAFVSVSCHTLEEVRAARECGASAVLFGPVFGKVVDGVEVVPGIGLEMLREACVVAGEMAVLALGGVSEGNAEACVEVGAKGAAAIRWFFPC